MSKNKILLILIWLYLLIIFNSYGQNNPVCRGKRYLCDTNKTITDANTCAKVNDTRNRWVLLKPCSNENSGQKCDWSDAEYGTPGTCQTVTTTTLTLPGEYCKRNSECYSNTCINSVCVGIQYNQTCAIDADCDVGLFCSDLKRCDYQKLIGSNCSRDEQCGNNLACSLGSCVYYYSFDNFLPANNSRACASGYILNGTCYPGLISTIKGRPCSSNDDCTALNYQGKVVQYGQCQCGYNGGGFTYCTLSEGDPEFQIYLNTLQFILATSTGCHTLLRFGPCHYMYDDDYRDFMKAKNYFAMYPQLVFNDKCCKQIMTWDYWKWASGYRLNANKLIMTIVLLILILLM